MDIVNVAAVHVLGALDRIGVHPMARTLNELFLSGAVGILVQPSLEGLDADVKLSDPRPGFAKTAEAAQEWLKKEGKPPRP